MEPNGYRVLIVDDESESREVYGDFLRKRGFEVETAADGAEALARLESSDFDVALVDLRMPGMSGTQLIREIRARPHDPSIIVITAYGERAEAVDALNAGADYWFDKGTIDMGELYEKVKELAPLIPPDVASELLEALNNKG
jgi:two-component system response regulator AtoC